MTPEIHWTAYLTAFSTPVIAVFAALIGYRQWKTAHTKLILDLFDRRVKVYEITHSTIGLLLKIGGPTDQQLYRFLEESSHSRWLFDEEIAAYLHLIYDKALDMQTLNSELKDPTLTPDERGQKLLQRRAIKQWMYAQFQISRDRFTPFLRIQQPSLLTRLYSAIPTVPVDRSEGK